MPEKTKLPQNTDKNLELDDLTVDPEEASDLKGGGTATWNTGETDSAPASTQSHTGIASWIPASWGGP